MKLSIVIPLFNEEGLIKELYAQTSASLDGITEDWEVICVNDGSTDHTLSELLSIRQKDRRWKILSLSKNFGHQAAIWAGLSHAEGGYIGIMDGDLQDNPQMFSIFCKELEAGADIVYAVRKGRKESVLKTSAYWVFYRMVRYVFGVTIPSDSGDFCLMKKQVVTEMLKMPEQGLFVRGIRSWVGFRQKGIVCERQQRISGHSKYSVKKLLHLAYNGLFSFSDVPIRLLGRLGVMTILFSIVYAVYILSKRLFWGQVPEGFTTLIIVILFFGGVQLVTIRILGEYIYRIYNESRKRPLYIIQNHYGLTEETTNAIQP